MNPLVTGVSIIGFMVSAPAAFVLTESTSWSFRRWIATAVAAAALNGVLIGAMTWSSLNSAGVA